MFKLDRSAQLLLALIVVLLIPTAILVLSDKKEPIIPEVMVVPDIVLQDNIEFEVNVDTVDTNEYVDQIVKRDASEIDEIVSVDLTLDEVGTFKGKFTYVFEEREFTQDFEYVVYDQTPPVILQSENFRVAQYGTLDYQEYLSVQDNSLKEGETLEIKVEGNVNFDVVGRYYVSVTAEDASGNIGGYEAVVIVYAPESSETGGTPSTTQTPPPTTQTPPPTVKPPFETESGNNETQEPSPDPGDNGEEPSPEPSLQEENE